MRPVDRIAAIERLDQDIATYQAEDRARIRQPRGVAVTAHRTERETAMAATAWRWPAGVSFGGGDA